MDRPIVDSARALSYASETMPIQGAIPAQARRSVRAMDVYWTELSAAVAKWFSQDFREWVTVRHGGGIVRTVC